jgi:hypothetical protein
MQMTELNTSVLFLQYIEDIYIHDCTLVTFVNWKLDTYTFEFIHATPPTKVLIGRHKYTYGYAYYYVMH